MKNKKGNKTLNLLLFFLLGVGVGIAFGMASALLLRHNKKEIEKEYKYETVSLSSCNHEAKLYYQEKDRKIYLYCLNSIKVKDGKNVLELKNYLQNHSDEIDKMLEKMVIAAQYEDGGTTLYIDNGELSENGFSILKCSTLMGSKDIYIGPKSMKYEKQFCQVDENKIVKNFTRTYSVLNVQPSNDEKYFYITIKMFQDDEVAAVRIPSDFASTIQAGKNYEFKFSYTGKIEDTILSIFENATILSIQETNKVGLEQTQDPL